MYDVLSRNDVVADNFRVAIIAFISILYYRQPCPFVPYSDTSLIGSSLKDVLQAELLRTICKNHENIRETEDGGALWIERK